MPAFGPPPSLGILQQQQPPAGPAAMSAGMPPQSPTGAVQPAQGPNPAPNDPIEGQFIVASIHLQEMVKTEPALAPWVTQAMNLLQQGVRQVLAQHRAAQGMTEPAQSATPPTEPGAGLPM